MHIDKVWIDLLSRAISGQEVPAKQDSIREIIGAHFVLDGAAEQMLLNPRRRLSAVYASAELLWYLSRTRSAEMICAYAPKYAEFCENGQAYGAYGDRIANNTLKDQLSLVIEMLRKRATSKKCVVSLWRPSDLIATYDGTAKDIPCTLTWQFIARGEKLHMICNMRSQDLWRGCLYDCYVNTIIQRYVAAQIGMVAGEYHHIAGSEHLYERDVKKAREALQAFYDQYPDEFDFEPVRPTDCDWTDDMLRVCLEVESAVRQGRQFCMSDDFLPEPLRDALLACCSKWAEADTSRIRSPGLRKAMDQFLCKQNQTTS